MRTPSFIQQLLVLGGLVLALVLYTLYAYGTGFSIIVAVLMAFVVAITL